MLNNSMPTDISCGTAEPPQDVQGSPLHSVLCNALGSLLLLLYLLA